MCGLFGAIGPLPDGALDRVSAAIRHRGPDSEGRFIEGEVALLHRRLKIIDLSPAAAQPMANEDGTIQVVFNGEIYNHRTLARELAALGHIFRSRGDTEVIVHGYEAWGDRVIERLDGMFALALWDRRTKRLLLARDRAGKKPLFYSQTGGTFRFGSTPGALHASGLPRAVDEASLPYYLAFGYPPLDGSAHRDVRQLPPATVLSLSSGGAPELRTYWRPAFGASQSSDSFPAACEKVRALTTAAVDRRLESDVPLGAFLSGGIDSTIVVGLMARALGRVRTFSIGFAGDRRYDETAFARIAAGAFGTEHTEFELEASALGELIETLVAHHDGPFGDSSALPTYMVSKLTREHVTVALTGDGGDELFCGYTRFLAAEAAERIPAVVRRAATRLGALLPGASRERTLLGKAKRFLSSSGLPMADRMAAWHPFFPDLRAILRPELSASLGGAVDAPLAWQRAVFAEAPQAAPLEQVLDHNFRTYLPGDLLVKSDRTSMAHGLELRSPFLDTALIEYAATLPPGYLRRGTLTKRVLRQAFADLLPPAIATRGKMGFGVPLGSWFRSQLEPLLADRLGDGARLYQYLDRAKVQTLVLEHRQERADHGQRLWLLLTLEIWLRSLESSNSLRAAA